MDETGPQDRITSDPAIFGGKPIIRGQRFAVEHLLGYLGAGMSPSDLLTEFPFLEVQDLQAVFLYAAQKVNLNDDIVVGARMVLRCDDDARAEGRYGILDAVDNHGEHYTSGYLGRALDMLRAQLTPALVREPSPAPGAKEK